LQSLFLLKRWVVYFFFLIKKNFFCIKRMAYTRRTANFEKNESFKNSENSSSTAGPSQKPMENFVSLSSINPYMFVFFYLIFIKNFSLEPALYVMGILLMQLQLLIVYILFVNRVCSNILMKVCF